ncbi:LysR family transcriptional regulator [Nannocystis pusilla]|uniref:LysR family transcriptional regulator n=1 Tax=Nannocystis pusilla TaxID=889268 RepID=UPI003B834F92
MDQLLAIRVFTRVVEAGSFTKAAAALQLPKATVTNWYRGWRRGCGCSCSSGPRGESR